MAVPKGRILSEIIPLMEKADIMPEDEFFDSDSRKLTFNTNIPNLKIIKVRSFDVATLVSYGAAHIGICGSDVMLEFNYDNIYNLLDLKVGKCRLSIASKEGLDEQKEIWNKSHLRVSTKYVNYTKQYFASKGIQAECIKLNGSIELAPALSLSNIIVDLVSTGSTLKANDMVEKEVLAEVSSFLVANKGAYKTEKGFFADIVSRFEKIV
jgi:ATP phosphoribosyltransferase